MYAQTQYHVQSYNPAVQSQPQYSATNYAGAPQQAAHVASYAHGTVTPSQLSGTHSHMQQLQQQFHQSQQVLQHSQSLPTPGLFQSEPLVRPTSIFTTQDFNTAQYQRVLKRLASVQRPMRASTTTPSSPVLEHSDPAQEAEIARLREEVRSLRTRLAESQGHVESLTKKLQFYEQDESNGQVGQAGEDGWGATDGKDFFA